MQWARAEDLDWGELEVPACQADLDAYRLNVLKARSLKQIHQLMEAKWYVKQWDGHAPSDLRDPLLGATWLRLISDLAAEKLERAQLEEMLKSCRFDFREMIDPASSRCSVSDLLEYFSPVQLSALGEPQRNWLSSSWASPPRVSETHSSNGKPTRRLNNDDRAAILEWFVLRHVNDQLDHNHLEWFEGKNAYEAIAA